MTNSKDGQMEIIGILAKIRNLHNFSERLNCYKQIFRFDKEFLDSKIINTEWIVQFVRDVFENLENPDADEWCYNQLAPLFVDSNLDVGPKVYEKLSNWLVKDGLPIVKKCLKNQKYGTKAIAVWGVALRILGQQALRSSETVNTCNSVFPFAFKSPNVQTVKEAFRSWKVLVTIFAKDPSWSQLETSQEKNIRIAHRLDLIMKALRYRIWQPEIAPEITDCWWCCCTSLGPRLIPLFEDLAHSLLRFCVGGKPNYLNTDEQFELILNAVQEQLNPNGVMFLMNLKLAGNSFSRHTWNHVPELVPKLVDLLDSFICANFSCFNDAQIVRDHGLFAFQCIRYCDHMCTEQFCQQMHIEKEHIGESISKLVCELGKKMAMASTRMNAKDRAAQCILFLAQFVAWLKESALPSQILLDTFANAEPDIAQITSVFDENDPIYGKYFTELKASLADAKNSLFKLCGGTPTIQQYADAPTLLIDSIICAHGDIELSTIKSAEGNSLNETTLIEQNGNRSEELEESMKKSEEEKIEKRDLLGEGAGGATAKIDEEPEENGNGLEIDEAQEHEEEEEDERKEEPKKDEEQGLTDGMPNGRQNENGSLNEGNAVKLGMEEHATELAVDERQEDETQMEESGKEEETEMAAEIEKLKRGGEYGTGAEEKNTPVQSPAKSDGSPLKTPRTPKNDGSPPKTPRTPNLKLRTPSSILRKADSPGSKKNRRVQFQISDEGTTPTTERGSVSGTTSIGTPSPFLKRKPLDSEENCSTSVGVSPAKRAMNAFGQNWPIHKKSPSTPTFRHKAVRRLNTIQECHSASASPYKETVEGVEQTQKGTGEVFERITRRMDETMGEMRREMTEQMDEMKREMTGRMDRMLQEGKKQMIQIVAEELNQPNNNG